MKLKSFLVPGLSILALLAVTPAKASKLSLVSEILADPALKAYVSEKIEKPGDFGYHFVSLKSQGWEGKTDDQGKYFRIDRIQLSYSHNYIENRNCEVEVEYTLTQKGDVFAGAVSKITDSCSEF